ncbi:hypothetical protein H0H92_001283 [Tricholoma furcatifolium]|nr:hypothetical protein H0H92_001283 [Tricholoma furcatifolium]
MAPNNPPPGFGVAHGPPPPIPGNRPSGPSSSAASYQPPPSYGAYGPPPMPMPVPDPMPTSVQTPLVPQANHADTVLQTIPYNGLIVPNPRAPPLAYGVPKVQGYDPAVDADIIMKACKGFGTDEAALIKTLPKIGILRMNALADFYVMKYGKRLVDLLDKETGSWFGTDEELLTEIIMDRSSDDLYRLSIEYKYKYGTELAVKIKGDLSGKAEKMFLMALNARRPPDDAPIDFAAVDQDILNLYHAGQARAGTDEIVFFDVILARSRPHLAAVIGGYGQKYRSLTKVIKSEFSGHTRDSLLFVVNGVKPKRDGKGIWRDAKLIEKAMAGFGTKDKQLVYRIVRAHWDPYRMAAIKQAYQNRMNKTLDARVKGETSGDHQKLMLALIKAEHQ